MAAPQPLLIFTDVEPDDLLALWILDRRGLLGGATVVVTENDAGALRRKEAIVAGRHATRGPGAITILAGATSARPRDFPRDAPCGSGRPFAWPDRAPPTILCLAPPRDLLAAPAGYFRNTVLWAYGGFNFREVTRRGDEIPRLLGGFARAHVFETRHVLPMASFFAEPPGAANLEWHARHWNGQQRERLAEELGRAEEPARSRIAAVIRTIDAYPAEVCAADPLVAAFVGLTATRPCHLEFPPGANASTLQACEPSETNTYALFGVSEAAVWDVLNGAAPP